jgi:hypothetical protein
MAEGGFLLRAGLSRVGCGLARLKLTPLAQTWSAIFGVIYEGRHGGESANSSFSIGQ